MISTGKSIIRFCLTYFLMSFFLSCVRSGSVNKINGSKKYSVNKMTLSFLSRLEGFESKSICRSLLRSDIQAKLNSFKSIISTCPGENYCRLAMRANGRIFGAQNSGVETILNFIQIENYELFRDGSLLGAHYIEFMHTGRYLCINKKLKLFSSRTKSKSCLWYTNEDPIYSAYYRNVKLIVRRRKNFCQVLTEIFIPNPYSQINSNQECRNTFHSEKSYSTELNILKAKCVNVNDYLIPVQQKTPYRRITTKSISSQTMIDQFCSHYLNNKPYQKILEFDMSESFKICQKYFEKNQKTFGMNNFPQKIEFKSNIDQSPKDSLTIPDNFSGKKCYIYRNTPFYKSCVLKHYKCFKYKDNPTRLKNCRKKFEITVPIKKF